MFTVGRFGNLLVLFLGLRLPPGFSAVAPPSRMAALAFGVQLFSSPLPVSIGQGLPRRRPGFLGWGTTTLSVRTAPKSMRSAKYMVD